MPELLLAVLLLPKFFGLSIGLGGAAWDRLRHCIVREHAN